ncbi:SDH family Clp fold serine proteinase [Sphaerimonospora mesophila]|uniref:SDH family Clp fold serine proteinase n=1 Tax=Sphaerimonospora mesophila TaxID=37483 RepID=UPI000A74E9FF
MNEHDILPALVELQQLSGSPTMAYIVDKIEVTDVGIVYECLRALGRVESLNLILYAGGGNVDAARHIALLLHEYCEELRILVPDHAQSAGTLLCLGAHELVLGTMARLGPIDPYITASDSHAPGGPNRISAEDVRALTEMARTWFGLDGQAAGRHALEMMSQRIFPTTLSSFFRAHRNIRNVGRELIAYHRSDLSADERGRLVDHLVDGYDSHTHVITPAEAQKLGLNVVVPSLREEQLMWRCLHSLHRWLKGDLDEDGQVMKIIANSQGFCAELTLVGVSLNSLEGRMPKRVWGIEERSAATISGAEE